MSLVNTATAALTPVEQNRLAHEEAVIERGLDTFVAVGKALLAIRDQRLYRQSHSSFAAYVTERWGMTDGRAAQMIVAAEVAEALPAGEDEALTGVSGPANEAQARELAPLRDDPEKMRDVWQRANEATGGKPTAKAIREARGVTTPQSSDEAGSQPCDTPLPDDDVVDAEIVEDDEPADLRPSVEAYARHTAERDRQTSREVFSKNLARSVYLLANYAAVIGAAKAAVQDFESSQDIYPEPLTPARMRAAADYLHDVADEWEASR